MELAGKGFRCPRVRANPDMSPLPPAPRPAAQLGVSAEARKRVDACIDGSEGRGLMARDAGAARDRKPLMEGHSCTIFIDGMRRCARNAGRWCADGGLG